MSEPRGPTVSVVVPVHNEAGNIAPLAAEIAAALDGRWSFEAVFVNDGSTDTTGDELRDLMAKYPWLRVLSHQQSCGQSAAVRSGLLAARGAIVATLDGDGQNDPAFLPKLIETLQAGAPQVGLVAGQRLSRTDTGLKRIISRSANRLLNAVLRTSTRDTGCGLKAVRRDVFLALPYFDGLHRYMSALVQREGFEVAHVDVVDRPRGFGRSHYRIWDRVWVTLADLLGVRWLLNRRRRVPKVSEEVANAR